LSQFRLDCGLQLQLGSVFIDPFDNAQHWLKGKDEKRRIR